MFVRGPAWWKKIAFHLCPSGLFLPPEGRCGSDSRGTEPAGGSALPSRCCWIVGGRKGEESRLQKSSKQITALSHRGRCFSAPTIFLPLSASRGLWRVAAEEHELQGEAIGQSSDPGGEETSSVSKVELEIGAGVC
jgi:hypothetical protein